MVAKFTPSTIKEKPLGRKAYGSIGHLPMSRLGPGDHSIHDGQAKILTEKVRDRHDTIIVQEKMDGGNVAVARIGEEIIALGRAGWPAWSSPYEQHHVFARWVQANESRFRPLLTDGEWISGEWLAQAHGTIYELEGRDPFAAFDLWVKNSRRRPHERAVHDVFADRVGDSLSVPWMLYKGNEPLSVEAALDRLGPHGMYGATDPVEGAVWRCERDGRVDFLAKYVRPDKVDGKYLPEVTGNAAVWNWTF